jgi:hypothetical protein
MRAPQLGDRRRTIRAAAFAVAAFLGGMALRAATQESPAPAPDHADSTGAMVVVGPGPDSVSRGLASGFAHSDSGARAAAGRMVLAGGPLLSMTTRQAADAMRAMAANESANGLVAENERDTQAVLDRLEAGTGPVRFDQAVLSTALDAYDQGRARVRVWSVGVLARTGAAPPQAGWRTTTVDLVWERDDWRLWGWSVVSGPTPQLNGGSAPASNDELDRALAGFEPWRDLP